MNRLICVFAAALLLAAPAVSMQGRGKGKGRGHANEAASKAAPLDRDVIVNYYRDAPGGLPPGLAKREGLPPGLENHLRRNGTLPPGLAKKIAPMPRALDARLGPCPPDARRGIIGGIAVMYNSRTGLVIDSVVITGR
jgi:hypothetical protein